MRALIVVAMLTAVTGCVSENKKLSDEELAQSDTDILCRMSLKSKAQHAPAEIELNRRNATCDWKKLHLIKLVQAPDSSNNDQISSAAQQMGSGGMPHNPMLATNPSVCTTTYQNNQSHTICQ